MDLVLLYANSPGDGETMRHLSYSLRRATRRLARHEHVFAWLLAQPRVYRKRWSHHGGLGPNRDQDPSNKVWGAVWHSMLMELQDHLRARLNYQPLNDETVGDLYEAVLGWPLLT